MDIIAEKKLKTASQIYYCLVKAASDNKCTIAFNNNQYVVPYYGGAPIPNKTYALFLPQNNMNQAFVVGEGGGGGGGGSGIAIQPDEPINGELVWIDTDDSVLQFRETKNDPWQKLSADFGSPVPVSMGGTEANNAADARVNLGILDYVYPVGSIYMSVNATSPATLFGGTWEQIQNRFLLAAGTSYTAGATGGEATHTLTTTEMPSHTHNIYGGDSSNVPDWFGGSGANYGILGRAGTAYNYLQYVGGGGAHNNMPPYLVVYIWKRTA